MKPNLDLHFLRAFFQIRDAEILQLEPFTIFLLKTDDVGLLNKIQLKIETIRDPFLLASQPISCPLKQVRLFRLFGLFVDDQMMAIKATLFFTPKLVEFRNVQLFTSQK